MCDKEIKELWDAVAMISNSMTKITGALETITEFNTLVVKDLEQIKER